MRRRGEQPTTEEMVKYLQECSRVGLGDLFLELFRRDCELRKEIGALFNEAIDNGSLLRLAQIRRDFGHLLDLPDLRRLDLPRRPKSKR